MRSCSAARWRTRVLSSGPRTPRWTTQVAKFDLVCRKLDLRPGQDLLDVGAGWGGLIRHAAAP